MLVKLVDQKDKETWINPLFVRAIVSKGDDRCEVHGMFAQTMTGSVIKMKRSAQDVANEISAAMPDSPAWGAVAASGAAEAADQSSQAATIAAMG